MQKLVVTYKMPANPKAFDRYYNDIHVPLANKVPKLKEFRVNKVFGTPAGRPDIYLIAEMCFANKDDFKEAMNSPEMLNCGKDLKNFAEGLTSLYFAEEGPIMEGR